MSNGFILYEGPSCIDGKPIVVIVTGVEQDSGNDKTGPMLQVWILPRDLNPIAASISGLDFSVCGSCCHRWHTGGACYVNIAWAVQAIHRAYKNGVYRDDDSALDDALVRIAAWGDPAAVPSGVWKRLLARVREVTAYTHQWRNLNATWWGWCMASVDSADERVEAVTSGWSTFRVRLEDEEVLPGEVICPGSKEAGQKMTCAQCLRCDGRKVKHSVIIAHGLRAPKYTLGRKCVGLFPGVNPYHHLENP